MLFKSVLVSILSTKHKAKSPRKRELQLSEHLLHIGLQIFSYDIFLIGDWWWMIQSTLYGAAPKQLGLGVVSLWHRHGDKCKPGSKSVSKSSVASDRIPGYRFCLDFLHCWTMTSRGMPNKPFSPHSLLVSVFIPKAEP